MCRRSRPSPLQRPRSRPPPVAVAAADTDSAAPADAPDPVRSRDIDGLPANDATVEPTAYMPRCNTAIADATVQTPARNL